MCHSLAAVDASNEAETAEVEKQLKAVVNKESDLGSLSVKKEKVREFFEFISWTLCKKSKN